MRLNGLTLALATLLAPVGVLAQTLPAAESAPPQPQAAQDAPASAPDPAPLAAETAPAPAQDGSVATEAAPSQASPGAAPAPDTAQAPEAAPVDAVPTDITTTEIPADATAAEVPADPTATQSPDPDDATATAGPQDGTDAPTEPATLAPTEAEKEFAEIYGQEYNPVADPSLPEPVTLPGAFDPWEKYNRKMHRFNNAVDRGVAKPLARGYVKVVPRPFRLGVSNFFSNLGQPLTAVNALLQGKPKAAGQAMGRFLLNSTLGIGGIFDPARDAKLPHRNEDFGQTLGVWGWKRSRYVELPLFGPRTVRDVFGMVGDAPLSPLRRVEVDRVRIPLQGLQLVDLRSQLLSTDSLREGAEDDYTLVRDAWSQRRDYQIFGERAQDEDAGLPDYLLEGEDQPTVPVDAMPMPPAGGGT